MEKIKSVSTFEVKINLELTEVEARALEAITVYGTKSFLDYFYRDLGKHYLQPHEKGVYSLFETIKSELPKHLNKANEIREIIKNK